MRAKLNFNQLPYSELKKIIRDKPKKLVLSFMNANDVYEYSKNESFRKSIKDKKMNRIILVDGITTALFLSIKKFKTIRRLQGPTFTDEFLKDKKLVGDRKHFFIGIKKEDLKKVQSKYPNLKLRNLEGYAHPFIKEFRFSLKERKKMTSLINKQKPDYLWIGAGCPRQEILASDIYDNINVKCIFNVGASLEYIQGKRKRAPVIFQKFGMEWFYRLFSDFRLTSGRLSKIFIGSFLVFFIADIK